MDSFVGTFARRLVGNEVGVALGRSLALNPNFDYAWRGKLTNFPKTLKKASSCDCAG